MNKKKSFVVGIDVSKGTINAYFKGKDCEYENNRRGWNMLLKEAPSKAAFAMEATGNYHYKLASHLRAKGFDVLVFNPLWVRRYMQSLGSKAKTDRKDAELIAKYAGTEDAQKQSWEPLPPKLARAKVVAALLARLAKMERAAGNMNHAISLVAGKGDSLLDPMGNVSDVCKEQQKALKEELCGLVGELFPEKFRLLQSIPGIGAKTAACILVGTKGLEFKTCRQLASFVGLAPCVYESGVSVRGRGRIRKTGNSYLRALLYVCTMQATKTCKPCADLYDRLVGRGKPKLLARVAVMHRLVKIAFGVIQSGEPYRGGRVQASPT
jgi:transposase